MKINPTSVFFCDDMRREDNGKFFILGLYGHGIVIKDPNNDPYGPKHITIAIGVIFTSDADGHCEVMLQLEVPGPKTMEFKVGFDQTLKPNNNEFQFIPLKGINIPITQEGDIVVRYKTDDDWVHLGHIPLTYGVPTSFVEYRSPDLNSSS